MDTIAIEITIEQIDGVPTVVLHQGKSIAYLTANEAYAIAEALAYGAGLVEGQKETLGMAEPEAVSMEYTSEDGKPHQSLEDFLEEVGQATYEVEPEKKILH